MVRIMGIVLGAAMSLLLAGGSRAAEADAIVDKAIQAHGGAEKLGKYKAEQWKARGVMQSPMGKLEYTAEYAHQDPNLFRFDATADIGGNKVTITAITDGKNAWEKMGDMVREMEKKKFAAFQHNMYTTRLTQLLPLKEKGFTLTAAGEDKVNDKPALAVKVSHKDHPDVTLYFDKATNRLVKTSTKIWDEFSDKDVTQEVYLSDYKEKDGVLRYHKVVIHREGKPFLEEEFTDQKYTDKLDPKLFAKP